MCVCWSVRLSIGGERRGSEWRGKGQRYIVQIYGGKIYVDTMLHKCFATLAACDAVAWYRLRPVGVGLDLLSEI